jgi:RNA polymerase sigma-70 factor (ECF subfamily)
VQDAVVRAMERWPEQGVPADAEGWLLTVAHNLAADAARRDRRLTVLSPQHEGRAEPPALEMDDELGLVFLCCHPVLPRAAQVALTLRIAFGLGVPRIARAFFSDERTVAQRLVRAKQRLRDERVSFALPGPAELSARLDPVLDVLYLVFSEGYSPTEGEATVDETLCLESLRLARLLAATPRTATPAVEALCALFSFQASRSRARQADDGSALLLAEQDRSRWDERLVAEGFAHLDRAARGPAVSRFHVEAAIAACHAAAPSWAATDWPAIVRLYDDLRALSPSPVVEVNRALAVAMCAGALAGLDELDAIPERELCARYPYALAAYAELHASLGHLDEARAYLDRALEHQPSPPQRALLRRKRAALDR